MLRSELFRGNTRLERCAVNHAHHVVQGNRGDFVSKIQEALVMLDGAVITGDEIPTQTYGPSTAQAVLDYKSARNIVNRTYQTTADNIVGIMTINRMDTEMAALEALMPEMIRRTRLAAFQRTFAAFMRVVGIGPPPPPGRIDPNAENRRLARLVAIQVFNNTNPDMDDIGSALGDMRNRLVSSTLDRGHFPDPRVGSRSAFVVGNRIPIFLCPRFFTGGDEQRIRTFVHESAHLIGVGDPNGEAYYLRFNSVNENPQILVGTPTSTNRADQADTWAKYVNAVTNQPADP
jgi:peptidoglycan hydrolase-like protein with peptidoglycan-binding domain